MAVTPRDNHGSSAGSRFECSLCPKTFPRPCDLKKHTKFHERPVKCPYEDCAFHERGFSNEKELDRHINDRHTESPQMYSCSHPGCNHKSKRESNLRQHEKKKHNIDHQRNRSSGSYVIWLNNSMEDVVPFTPATTLVASRNLAAVPKTEHPKPLAFPLLRSPDHNENLNFALSRLHQLAIPEHGVTPVQGQTVNSAQGRELWNLAEAIPSGPPSVDSTNYSGSCAVQGKGASSTDRNTARTRKRKRGNGNAPELLGTGTSHAFDAGDGDDESVNGPAGDSEYDPYDGHRSPSLPSTEFNNSSQLQCPFKHVNPQIYTGSRESRYKQCDVKRGPISQITRHLTRRHGLSVVDNCISSFDAPEFDGVHHPSASLCKNCWKPFSVRAESESHFSRKCPPEARKALSRLEKFRLLCDTFCTIVPAASSSSSHSAAAQRRAHQPRRPSMLSHVSSAPAHDYFHDPQNTSYDGSQVAELQARIASIDQRIDELDFEKSELLRKVQELTQVVGAPQGPLNTFESQTNSQATERDVLVGGMDRPTEEGSYFANFPDDAEQTLTSYDGDMSMFDDTILGGLLLENT
ncbi:uncharacterized protein PpBr36_05950 [Pyricularia pennisetigena]|uniref:uncharacterized protein n=1 Tax=Pyricularia pennisetigena TaxID=1578925 RepID=UPI001150DD4E|nr:uncharacterized protein PpBr36_05950 [Pyricularia pennisetigena]TLS23333.1 hypothetical protein PpBr36_05950 [Pyricularia pennisetigena]